MRDSRVILVAAALLVLGLGATAPGLAQVDFSGNWRLEVEAVQPDLPVPMATLAPALAPKAMAPCIYSGTVALTQDGGSVTGPAELFLLSGPESCPAEMSGFLTGAISGDKAGGFLIEGTIEGSDPTGTSSFSGTISPNPGGSGEFLVTAGDFGDTSGTWSAVLLASVIEVPGLRPLGLALLTALLLGTGAWILARRPA